jgi:hypothetical protein
VAVAGSSSALGLTGHQSGSPQSSTTTIFSSSSCGIFPKSKIRFGPKFFTEGYKISKEKKSERTSLVHREHGLVVEGGTSQVTRVMGFLTSPIIIKKWSLSLRLRISQQYSKWRGCHLF